MVSFGSTLSHNGVRKSIVFMAWVHELFLFELSRSIVGGLGLLTFELVHQIL
jgi:hypothetical protein